MKVNDDVCDHDDADDNHDDDDDDGNDDDDAGTELTMTRIQTQHRGTTSLPT